MSLKIYQILSIFLIFTINFKTSLAATDEAKNVHPPRHNVCDTLICQDTAKQVIAKMDPTVDPCDNFYQFACGNFLKSPELNDAFHQNYELILYFLAWIIENFIQKDDILPFRKLQSYYNACKNEEQIDQDSDREFVELLSNVSGLPVVVGQFWNESKFDWRQSAYRFRDMGLNINNFISIDVEIDAKNSSIRRIHINQPEFDVYREYLVQGLEHDNVKAYLQALVDIAVTFGANRKDAEQELIESVNFEVELARITLPQNDRRNASQFYNPMTIQELESKYPFVPWLVYINSILLPDMYVHSHETVVVDVPTFLEKLSVLLIKTPKRVQANYVFSRITVQMSVALSSKVRTILNKYQSVVLGTTVNSDRSTTCLVDLTKQLDFVVNSLYVRIVFNETAKKEAIEMIRKIHEVFHDILNKVKWMDAKSKSVAVEKLRNVQYLVAFTDDSYNNDSLVEYYKDLKIYPENFLKYKLKLNLFQLEKKFRRLKVPVKRGEWPDHIGVTQINAFSRLSNSIVLPPGILQGLFLTPERPKYFNYGAAGTIVGHELMHLFDDLGRQFDMNGNLADWWDSDTEKMFLERVQCAVDQYNNYTVGGIHLNINGTKSLGETIADTSGLKTAYLAYRAFERSQHSEEPRLPGLEVFSPRQMFWIGLANVWCSQTASEHELITAVHPPTELRIRAAVSNRPEFAEDFKCPVGSKMNPVKKCNLW